MKGFEAVHGLGSATSSFLDGRSRLQSLVDYEGGRQTVFGIVAEPGMGKTTLLEGAVDRAKSEGYATHLLRLDGWTSEDAASRIVRVACEAVRSRSSGDVLVAIDDVPPADESVVRREARAINRMSGAGCIVLIGMVPEAEQLLESLGRYCRLTSSDLLCVDRASAYHRSGVSSVADLTGGIPALVSSLKPGSGDALIGADGIPTSYYDSLDELVRGSMRTTLMSEEIDVRLAMLLLGWGDFDDLSWILGPESLEIVEDLEGMAPLFGVVPGTRTFSCPGMSSPYALGVCSRQLQTLGGERPRVAALAADVLASRGDFSRAASVCSLTRDPESLVVVERWGTEMLDMGRADLVSCAIASDGTSAERTPQREMLESALSALRDKHPKIADEPDVIDFETSDREVANSVLLGMARKGMRGVRPRLKDEIVASSSLERLVLHLRAFDLMCDGMPDAAFRLLVAHAAQQDEHTLSSGLLALDYEAARLLLCEMPMREGESVSAAMEMVGSRESGGLRGLARTVCAMGAVVRGASSVSEIAEAERLTSAMEDSGDALLQSVALLIGAISDLESGYASRAHVWASIATSVAESLDYVYVEDVARILDCAARFELGDVIAREDLRVGYDSRENPDLARIATVLAQVMLDEEDGVTSLDARGANWDRVPRNSLWLLVVLTNGAGRLSGILESAMPMRWRRAVDHVKQSREDASLEMTDGEPDEQLALPKAEEQGLGPTVMVSLLGGFSVRVGGREMGEGRLDHRKAKSMFEYLLLCRRHTARRFQIVEQLWPGVDYSSGLGRVYQSTATIRAVISEMSDRKVDPFITSKAARSISVNSAVVRCDVDDFRGMAKAALASKDEELTVELARRIDELYAGDLHVPPTDSSGYITACRAELRRLHADSMVAGAEAAFRLGRNHAATRFAEVALMSDDLREDAIIELVRALRASGRAIEAERRYRAYSRRLVEKTDRPPSRMLRIAAGEDCGTEGTTGERRCEDTNIGITE